MASFSVPAFAKLSPRISRAERELLQLEDYFRRHVDEVSGGDWGALSAVSLGVHNIYNGIEDILTSLARDVDDFVPVGPAAHQDILDQMAAEVGGIRPALLDPQLYETLTEIKGFRHLVRHKYGFDLKSEKVVENVERIRHAFPAFVEAVVTLERVMAGNGEGISPSSQF
jgi:uncharacterized protein YutE (UPF0331/DUF86 family)